MRLLKELLRALAGPAKNRNPLPIEVPGEVVKAPRIQFEDTRPLEKELVVGSLITDEELSIPGPAADIAKYARYAMSLDGDHATAWTQVSYHFKNKWNVDVRVSRPYVMRQDEKGCIVQVEPKAIDPPEGG